MGFRKAPELLSPPPEPAGLPHPFLSKGCKMYAPALQGFGGINHLCLSPKRQRDYRAKTWEKFLVCDRYSCSWPHRVGGWGRGEKWPLPSHSCNGWRKRIFCHLQTIFCLGRAAAWKIPVGGTAVQLILRPESEAVERSSAEKGTSLAQLGQH